MRTQDETYHVNWRHLFNEEERKILILASVPQPGIYGVVGKLELLLDIIATSVTFKPGDSK